MERLFLLIDEGEAIIFFVGSEDLRQTVTLRGFDIFDVLLFGLIKKVTVNIFDEKLTCMSSMKGMIETS